MKSVNGYGSPSDLKITDMRFVDIDGAPKRCTKMCIRDRYKDSLFSVCERYTRRARGC